MLTGKNTGLRRTSVVSLLGGILELQFLCGPGLERGLTGNREGCKLTTETNVSDGERSKELNSSRHFFSKAYLPLILPHWAWLWLLLCTLFTLALRMELRTLHL